MVLSNDYGKVVGRLTLDMERLDVTQIIECTITAVYVQHADGTKTISHFNLHANEAYEVETSHKSRAVAFVCWGLVPVAFVLGGITSGVWYLIGFLVGAVGTAINAGRHIDSLRRKGRIR